MELKINSLSEIEIYRDQKIGSGYISEVFKGKHKKSGTPVAVKIVF